MAAAGGRWFYAQGDKRHGPIELEPLVELFVTGQLPGATLVWRHGMSGWIPASSAPEFAGYLPPSLPGAAPAAAGDAPPKPQPVAAPAAPADPPRIAELRRRLADEAHWRAFPQLVDELRKEKRLDEALQVCREGLLKHPDYRLARIALAHVLMDRGRLELAQGELQAVLDTAPENLMAGRLLGECLELQGDAQAALRVYKATLEFAPRDPQLLERVRALGGEPAGSEAAPEPEAPEAEPPPPASEPPQHDPVREEDARPIPLVPAEDEFELERPIAGLRVVNAAKPAAAQARSTAADASYWPARSLAETDFPDLIQALHQRRWTGTLALTHLGRVKSVMVHEGRLLFASSSSKDDRMGDLLLRRGRISLQQYLDASQGVTTGKRLGSVLVEQGALEPDDLVNVVVEHTQEVIYSVFQWTDGFYRLKDGLEHEETITQPMSTPNLILEGIRRVEVWSRIERSVGGLDARYERALDWETQAGQLTLTPETRALLVEHQGVLSVREICQQASMLSDFELCRTVWAFRVIGVLRPVPPEIAS